MKKIYAILSAALLIVAAASCTKENTFADQNAAGGTTFTVSLDEDAKFAIDGTGKSTWTPGDIISIYNGNYGVQGDVLFRDAQGAWTDPNCAQDIQITQDMISADGKKVAFNVTIPEPNAGTWYLCAYGCPYMAAAFHHHGPVYAVFPHQIEGGIVPFLAATSTTTKKATFHNVSTLVAMKCSLPGVKYVTFENNDGESLVDNGSILFNNDGTLQGIYDPQRGAPKFISHVEGLGADDYFYIGMYAEWLNQGFTIKAYDADPASAAPVYTVTRKSKIALPEGHVLNLGDFYVNSKKNKNWTLLQADGDGGANIIDNNIDTFWSKEIGYNDPARIIIDFNAQKDFNTLIFSQVYKNPSVAASGLIHIYISNNLEENWTRISPDTAIALYDDAYRREYPLNGTYNARYIMLEVWNSYVPEKPASLAEFDIALKGTDHDFVSGNAGYAYPVLVNGGSENLGPNGEGWGYFYSDGSDLFPAVGVGRMQRVVGWLQNDAMGISCDTGYGNRLCFWSAYAWGWNNVTNGKIYQRFTLLPGRYNFAVAPDTRVSVGFVEIYATVAIGKQVPDIWEVGTKSLQYARLDTRTPVSDAVSFDFEITEISDVCVGCVGSTIPNTTPGVPYSECYFNFFRFNVNEVYK